MDLREVFEGSEDLASYSAGESIIEEGESGSCMYVVMEGEVSITLKDKVLGKAGPGEIIGEMALINSEKRSATITALTDCKLALIDKASFASLLRHVPDFSMFVMGVLADRLQRAYDLIQR